MERKWNRIAVIVARDKLTILGQSTEGTNSALISIDRVNLDNISETSLENTESDNHLVNGSVVTGVGLVGFLQLQGAIFLGIITKAVIAGYIGDHTVWSVSEVEWIPVNFGINSPTTTDQRHLSLISNLFRASDFYFSYTYDLCCEYFKWNYLHMQKFRAKNFSQSWDLDLMCGSFRSVDFDSLGRAFNFSLICRRSPHFAGTRYRKRGLNVDGFCANEVETEQILVAYGPPHHIMTFKQVRGSVPLHWSQASHGLVPKPEIVIHHRDLNLDSTRKHFENLIFRYGSPIKAVSLLSRGHHVHKTSTESGLAQEYNNAITYMKQVVGEEISLDEFDLKGAVVGDSGTSTPSTIEPIHSSMYTEARELAVRLVRECGWMWRGGSVEKNQKGIIRTNCVDCLDRTSIFQYIVGLHALSEQLIALGVLDHPLRPSWVHDTSARRSPEITSNQTLLPLIEEIFETCSDQLSYQYAGTATHKKYAADAMHGQSGTAKAKRGFLNEIFISLGRHYSSSFTDTDKQNALNLFLGLYTDVMEEVAVYEDVCNVENVDRWVHSRPVADRECPMRPASFCSPITSLPKNRYNSLNAQRIGNMRHISFS